MRISLLFQQFFLITTLSTFCITNNIAAVHSQCLEDQKSLLLEFKKSIKLNPSYSTKLVKWNQTKDCCTWNGVECDALGHVIGLQLDDDYINGDIENSTPLFSLGYLEKLNLAFNWFSGIRIPSGLYNLTNLTHLNLSNAGFDGQIPVEIGGMRSLVSLDLSLNSGLKLENPNLNILIQNLTGLTELLLDFVNMSAHGREWSQVLSSSLPSLRYLSLLDCYLSGPIDSFLLRLPSLSVLHLDANNLSTTVPEFFANFSGLTTLSLSDCSLQGYFPERIFQLPSLQNLDLSYNPLLTGTLPEFPKGGSLGNIDLRGTNLSGSVPESMSNLVMLSTIDLSNCHFSGPIPSTISDLPELVRLDFSLNTFTGSIPSFHKSKKLTYVDLSHNSLAGSLSSAHFKGLLNLVYLNLQNNSLSGSIPQTLFLLPSLQDLDLSFNKFSDQIKEFSTPLYSSNLETLDLSSNRLQGSIPNSFFKLKKLRLLHLSFNFFNGTIHLENFGELPDIIRLELGYNNLSVVTTSIRNSSSGFSLFSQLYWLGLASCNLYNFPDVRNQSELSYLDISNNQIRGKIPSWIWDIGIDNLNLSCNFLDQLEKPYNISYSIYYLDLHSNRLHGELPLLSSPAQYVDYSSNNFQESIPLNIGNFTSRAVFFSLANNSLIGSIPASFCNSRLMYASNLVLDLSGNNLNGSIPTCLIGNNPNLVVLNLGRNNISGNIADVFSVNCGLQTLDLGGNNLGGKIPASLANCKSLQVVNVGHNKMDDSFPCILKTLPSLRVLVLRSNRFHGKIKCPGVNQSWPNLQIMDVASNNFSGYFNPRFFSSWRETTPEELGQNQLGEVLAPDRFYYKDKVTVTMKGLEMEVVKILSVFTTFDFSCNSFHGKIPNAIGDLRSLHALNLSHNAFTGTIPASIGIMTQLESLDLSANLLTDKIPKELASLTFLSVMNLSFNKLSGMIPTGPQLQTFTAASYEGNEALCGFPLNVSCNDLVASNPKLETWHLYPKANINWDYVSAALGYVVGLGTIVCLLLYCKNWRQRYFEKVDQVFTKIFNHKGGRKRVRRNQVRRQ